MNRNSKGKARNTGDTTDESVSDGDDSPKDNGAHFNSRAAHPTKRDTASKDCFVMTLSALVIDMLETRLF